MKMLGPSRRPKADVSGTERYPVPMVDGKREPFWHHADNGVNDVAEPELPSEHRRVTAESRLPHVVADHHDRRSVDVFIGFDNRASDRRRHAGDVEADGRDLRDLDRLGGSARDDQVAPDGAERADLLDRLELAAPDM